MDATRQFLLDVVRSDDGELPRSSVRFVQVEFSRLKALEIAAASELKGQSPGVSIVGSRQAPPVVTDREAVWLDHAMRPRATKLRVSLQVDYRSPPTLRYCTLVHIDRNGGFWLWNLFGSNERVRSKVFPVDRLLEEFRTPLFHGCDIVEPGIRRLLQQQALPVLV